MRAVPATDWVTVHSFQSEWPGKILITFGVWTKPVVAALITALAPEARLSCGLTAVEGRMGEVDWVVYDAGFEPCAEVTLSVLDVDARCDVRGTRGSCGLDVGLGAGAGLSTG